MPKLNDVALVSFSRDLTKLAIENGFFSFLFVPTLPMRIKQKPFLIFTRHC